MRRLLDEIAGLGGAEQALDDAHRRLARLRRL
jgi:hypothetical protein